MKKATVLILNGPNLNLLGTRESHIYGDTSLSTLNKELSDLAKTLNLELECYQSNSEGDLINKLHSCKCQFIIINPAAYTHTSVALRDALLGIKTPFIEVHLSNIFARENYRHHSYLADIAIGIICGLGKYGYHSALYYGANYLYRKDK